MMTVAVCDMQSEDCEAQCVMWRCLNEVMARHGLLIVNFKGFMANSAGANWNAVCKIYGSGDPQTKMPDRERTCLLHWTTSMNRHTDNHIKKEFQEQHRLLCKQYKDSKMSADGEVRYLAIRAWWQSCGALDDAALKQLDQWLAFSHYQYQQWGVSMQMVSLPKSAHYIVIWPFFFVHTVNGG